MSYHGDIVGWEALAAEAEWVLVLAEAVWVLLVVPNMSMSLE